MMMMLLLVHDDVFLYRSSKDDVNDDDVTDDDELHFELYLLINFFHLLKDLKNDLNQRSWCKVGFNERNYKVERLCW